MKLAIFNKRITSVVSDSYVAPLGVTVIDSPEGFNMDRAADYIYENDQLSLAVPEKVTMRQARLALLQAGVYGNIPAILDAFPLQQKVAAQIEWEYALFVSRNSTLVNTLGASLGLNQTQLDQLFITAASIPD